MPPVAPGPDAPVAALRWREVAGPPPDLVDVCDALRVEACPWLLDSALAGPRLGRWSFVGADPPLVARVYANRVELHGRRPFWPGTPLGFRVVEGDPLETLRGLLPRIVDFVGRDGEPPAGLPFLGGAVGYLGYEVGAATEPVAMSRRDPLGFPDATLLFVDRLVAVDHVNARCFALGWGFAGTRDEAEARAAESLETAREWTGRVRPTAPARTPRPGATDDLARRLEMLATELPEAAERSLDRQAYEARVAALVDEIEAGNVYETNLTQRFSMPFDGDPLGLYRTLRRESPAPFASFLELPEGAILSSSPERFMRLGPDRSVESRPIKGTRPRGTTAEEDAALEHALVTSQKDRAENLMIVDLVRNDLGRVCEIGSVAVPELMAVEAYAGVFQLVSTVTGRLREDLDAIDLLCASFPPGSMTGAPKIAAMRLIDRIEPVQRGVYSGAIGYFDLRGGFDLSVVIRTLLIEKGRAHLHVGGAVVADSNPGDEHDETIVKARSLLAALARAGEN